MQPPAQPERLGMIRDVVETAIAGLALLGTIYGYMRQLARLNGLGGRVRKVEDALAEQSTTMHAIQGEQTRATDDRVRLHEDVGAAKRAAEASQEASEQARAAIVGAVHESQLAIVKEMSALRETLGQRMTAVETKMDVITGSKPRRQG